ncbi:MAG: hypothetical protein R3F02_01080 [Thiolinea sp.]
MRDSYKQLFASGLITKDQLFMFGLSETIYVDTKTAEDEWESLKNQIQSGKKVFIRGFGRDASGTHLFQKFYSHLIGNHKVAKDSTNNAEPTKLLREWTGYSKSGGKQFKPIRNYQISHVFGKTKNVYCFTAPWNIVYLPKIIDPFTGHEAKGAYVDEYTQLFQKETFKRFRALIEDFNQIVTGSEFQAKIRTAIELMSYEEEFTPKDINKLENAIKTEFSPINENA